MAISSIETLVPDEVGNRWDAEYYANDYRAYVARAFASWPSWKPLSQAAEKLTSGHTPLRHDVDTGDCDFLTVECVSPLTIHFDLAKKVWRKAVEGELSRVNLKKGDVLITIKRRIIDSCAVEETYGPTAVNQDIAVMTPTGDFLPSFVSAFLVSRVGKYQALRKQTEQMNPYIPVGSLGTLMLPVMPRSLQAEVASIVELRQFLLKRAHKSYVDAEALLLRSIGLDQVDVAPQLHYVSTFADTEIAGRMDAEYFSPRYRRILNQLSQDGRTIRDIAPVAQRRFTGKAGEKFNYIEISDLSGDGVAHSNPVDGDAAPSRAQWVVQPNDIITSTVRPIRRLSALIRQDQAGHVCSSGFAVLTPTNVEPEVLLTFLRAPIICEILDLYTTASMYPAISEARLLSMPASLPSDPVRAKIVEGVRASFADRQEAAVLLEAAKDKVESLVFGNCVAV
jgi:hypothetical protein